MTSNNEVGTLDDEWRSEGGQVTPSASAAGYSPEQLEDMDHDEIDDSTHEAGEGEQVPDVSGTQRGDTIPRRTTSSLDCRLETLGFTTPRPTSSGKSAPLSDANGRNTARVWVPVASLDYRCRGEAIVQGRVNREEQDCCSLFSKCLGDLNIIGFPRQLDSVKITSLGQLVNICGLVSEFLAGSVIEDYLVREADTAFDTRDLTVDMIAEGLKIAASKCCHLDVLLRENSANPVEICRSTVWDVSEAVLRQALARAYRLRAAQLRGPAAQLTFVARKTAEAFGRSLKDEIIFDNYAEIAQHLSRSGLKNIEVVVMVGDRTIGRMEELIPPVLHSGTKIGVVSAPYGTITESGLLDARSGYEQLRMRLSTTAVLTYSLLPEVAAISYYHACGEEPIKKGFNTLDTHKAALFAKSLRDTLRKTALIDVKATTWLGVPTVIATSSTRGMSRGGGRGGRGGGRGGRGGRGRGDGSRGGGAHRQGGRSTTHEHQSFLHRTHNGGV